MTSPRPRLLPGFGLSLGYTILYLSLMVLIPLSTLFLKTTQLSGEQFVATLTSARALASFRLTFGASAIAAMVNGVIGLLVAWVLVRYQFPGRALLDALVDLPFGLPTAVAGLALTSLYAPTGWMGQWLAKWGIQAAFSPLGVVLALTFIGLPFVVRTVQPVLQEVEAELEEVAGLLGANRWQTFTHVTLPHVLPALFTGITLAFARALGEYGSVVFISGNLPLRTEVTSLLIMSKLEQFDYVGATALAVVMLGLSFALLFLVNALQAWTARRQVAS